MLLFFVFGVVFDGILFIMVSFWGEEFCFWVVVRFVWLFVLFCLVFGW